jgi:hypothetical protein
MSYIVLDYISEGYYFWISSGPDAGTIYATPTQFTKEEILNYLAKHPGQIGSIYTLDQQKVKVKVEYKFTISDLDHTKS